MTTDEELAELEQARREADAARAAYAQARRDVEESRLRLHGAKVEKPTYRPPPAKVKAKRRAAGKAAKRARARSRR